MLRVIAASIFLATSPASSPTPALAAARAPAAEVPNVKVPSPAEMRREADESVSEMKTQMKKLLAMIEKARTQRDIVLLNCLNEKFTQMKALVRVADQASLNLQEFLAKDQVEGAVHERKKIALAATKVKSLLGEAESCLGEAGGSGGRTTVSVDKPDFTGDPTHLDTQYPAPDDLTTPPSASPYD